MTARERLRQAADWIDPSFVHRRHNAAELASSLRTLADRLDAEMTKANQEACESQVEQVRQHYAVEYNTLARLDADLDTTTPKEPG